MLQFIPKVGIWPQKLLFAWSGKNEGLVAMAARMKDGWKNAPCAAPFGAWVRLAKARHHRRPVLTLLSGILFGALSFLGAPATARGQVADVDLELILAVDVSPSVDQLEAGQQRKGYLDALAAPEIIAAIQSGPLGRIAVTYVEWAGAAFQRRVVDWAVIDDEVSAQRFVQMLQGQAISTAPGTSISGLIDYARRAFQSNGFEGARRVIDISGDGPNSDGRQVEIARDSALAEGITINGLPIENSRLTPGGGLPAIFLDSYYQDRVIGGPGAFYLLADFENFAPFIMQKLLREITGSSFDLSEAGSATGQ